MDVDSPRTKAGGLAFEVILKPANVESPPTHLAGSPPKSRAISQELIEKKLKQAEERRLSQEASRLQPVLKDKERVQDASHRVQELNSSFSKETERKLQEKMEVQEENKKAQIKALQDRLSQQESRAEKVRLNKMNRSVSEDKENDEEESKLNITDS
jgi:stathmin